MVIIKNSSAVDWLKNNGTTTLAATGSALRIKAKLSSDARKREENILEFNKQKIRAMDNCYKKRQNLSNRRLSVFQAEKQKRISPEASSELRA